MDYELRAKLNREFNFSDQVLSVYDLDDEIEKLKDQLHACESFRADKVERLPPEIYSLYEQWLVVEKLKGKE